jgi:acyl-CoA reductase-like NAD-dependent aldehyde dehydrogenase
MTTEQQQAPASESGAPTTYKMVIGGESVEAADGQTFDVINPATGKVVARAPLGGREDVDRAVAAAQKAFEDRKGWATWASAVGRSRSSRRSSSSTRRS